MKKYWILVAMLGTCLLWSAKTWGNEQVRRTVSHPAGWSGLPDYAGGYTGYGGYGGGTGDKPIGGRIMTTPNSKMTNDWLDFDNQLVLRSESTPPKRLRRPEALLPTVALEHDSSVQQIEQRNRKIAEQAELPKPAKGTITGIAYSENSASALLNSEIIHEGDIIQGIKVVKIRKGAVDFEKNGNRWTQRIKETPAPYWE